MFELTDALLCSPAPVGSVPSLSLEPVFRRSHGSVYKALARGGLDEERLRRLLVAVRPAGCGDQPGTGLLLLGVEVSTPPLFASPALPLFPTGLLG